MCRRQRKSLQHGCGAYERTFDIKEYSQLCQNLEVSVKNSDGSTSRKPYFDHPVAVKKSLLRLHPNEDVPRWDHKDAVKVIMLQTSAKIGAREKTLLQAISLLNKDSNIEDRPNSYALTAFAWHGSNNILPPTDIKKLFRNVQEVFISISRSQTKKSFYQESPI